MPVNGAVDIPLENFLGLTSDMAATDLPPGACPDCQDIEFLVGGVRTRGGIGSGLMSAPSGGSVNYMRTYITQQEQLRLLVLDSLGNLYKESSPLVLSSVATGILAPYAKSTTIFGREYIGFNDGQAGLDLPRAFDDVFFDRVSQVGPGAAPTVFDAQPELPVNIVAPLTGAVRFGSVVTITTTAPHGYVVGSTVTTAGIVDATMDGVFLITSVPSPTTFTYTQTGANSSSGSGTVTLTPQIVTGLRNFSVLFVTRSIFGNGQGYFTAPAPVGTWTPAGGLRATVTNIPTGPSNVVARILCFSLAGGGALYYVPNSSMVILDNTTTTATVDFSETQLSNGVNVTTLYSPLLELGECAGAIDYNQRLFWWGERNKIENFVNLTFDGGFDPTATFPLGWTVDPINGSGGQREATNVVWGFAYRITGDGATANRGQINQSAYKDSFGVPILQPNTTYNVRVKARVNNPFNGKSLVIQVTSASTGFAQAAIFLTNSMTTAYQEFILQLCVTPSVIPADMMISVLSSGTVGLGNSIYADCIEVYPANQPINLTLVRASRVQDPQSYDGVKGFMNIAQANGQSIRSAFKLRGNLYFVKERSFYVTSDDGANEPSLWGVDEVSATVGTYSMNGVAVGEDWAVIADRNGLFIYDGSSVMKVSQEIHDANGLAITSYWNNINWNFGYKLWVVVDKREKRILVGVPMAGQDHCNVILALDYRGCATGAEIADSPGVRISTYSGKLIAIDKGRKWSPWNISANSACIASRFDNTDQLLLGNNVNNGKIYAPSDANTSDDGAAINSYWTTSYFLHHDEEQQLQLGSHRKLFSYLTMLCEGNGTLTVSAVPSGNAPSQAVATFKLSNPGTALTIAALSRNANFVTVRTTVNHGLPNGTSVIVANPGDQTYSGFYSVFVTSADTFVYQQIGQADNVAAGGGTVVLASRDLETMVNYVAERVAFKISTNAPGEYFKLQKFVPSVEPDPWTPVRGSV